jgi:hypothetical protein
MRNQLQHYREDEACELWNSSPRIPKGWGKAAAKSSERARIRERRRWRTALSVGFLRTSRIFERILVPQCDSTHG